MKIMKVKKIVKAKKIDGSQDIWKLIDGEIRRFCQKIDRGIGYIVRDDIMRQFHDTTDHKWKIYLIDQKRLRDYVEKVVGQLCTVYEEEPDEEY